MLKRVVSDHHGATGRGSRARTLRTVCVLHHERRGCEQSMDGGFVSAIAAQYHANALPPLSEPLRHVGSDRRLSRAT